MRPLLALVAAGALLLAGQAPRGSAFVAAASAAEPPPDAELLEFLGTVDTADNGLTEYLERTDVAKMAGNHAPAAVQGAAPQPAPAGRAAADSKPQPAGAPASSAVDAPVNSSGAQQPGGKP